MRTSQQLVADSDVPPRLRLRWVFLLFGIATVARFGYFYLDDLTRQIPGTFLHRAIEEGTGNLASALLFPIAVLIERRYPLDRGRWRWSWIPHLGGFAVYSAAHTTLIAAMRAVVFPVAGMGSYDYGIMSFRFFMEGSQDLFSYTTFVGVITLLRVQQRLAEREARQAALERDAANARLEALSLRLQPHFLFNALNTISSTVYENPVAADELIGRLGELLRQALRTTERQEISLGEELETLDAYRALIEARFGDRVRFSLSVDDGARGLAVPAFLLQPLVENAVRHGMTIEFGEVEIDIRITVDGTRLRLIVENDTPQTTMRAEPTPARMGTGLGATSDRLNLLYGTSASLDTALTANRFRVMISIPGRAAAMPESADDLARAHR